MQRPEPGGEDVGGDAVDRVGELAEGLVAVEQGGDQTQAPAIADLANRTVERGVVDGHSDSLESLAIRK